MTLTHLYLQDLDYRKTQELPFELLPTLFPSKPSLKWALDSKVLNVWRHEMQRAEIIPLYDYDSYHTFSALCRQSGRYFTSIGKGRVMQGGFCYSLTKPTHGNIKFYYAIGCLQCQAIFFYKLLLDHKYWRVPLMRQPVDQKDAPK